MIRILNAQPPAVGGGWVLTYKEGRQTKTMRVEGKTEGEATGNAMRMGIKMERIVSLVEA